MSPAINYSIRIAKQTKFSLSFKRGLLPLVLLVLLITPATRQLTVDTLSDAFWAVSCYVAMTLAVYHCLASVLSQYKWVSESVNRSSTRQVIFASVMGALPGCGGAIIVTTQFISGRLGFGSVVAVLVSTMGDAAFLLLASEPVTGFYMVVMGIITGIISGITVNKFHSDDFLRPDPSRSNKFIARFAATDSASDKSSGKAVVMEKALNFQGALWAVIIVPGSAVALLGSFQVDVNEMFNLPGGSFEWLGALLLLVSVSLWSFTQEIEGYRTAVSEDDKCVSSHPMQKTAQDTNFVTAWVVGAFLIFEFGAELTQVDFNLLFTHWGVWLPLAGVLMGLLPGCGPQIVVTSLYLSGALPLSAQIGNAISNDGDALFPAIAMAPKASIVATIYSAVPALLLAYGYWWIFE